jgi:hypothetical protein
VFSGIGRHTRAEALRFCGLERAKTEVLAYLDATAKTKDQRPKTKDQRQKTKDQRQKTKDKRQKAKGEIRGSLDCAAHNETVNSFGRDDVF